MHMCAQVCIMTEHCEYMDALFDTSGKRMPVAMNKHAYFLCQPYIVQTNGMELC